MNADIYKALTTKDNVNLVLQNRAREDAFREKLIAAQQADKQAALQTQADLDAAQANMSRVKSGLLPRDVDILRTQNAEAYKPIQEGMVKYGMEPMKFFSSDEGIMAVKRYKDYIAQGLPHLPTALMNKENYRKSLEAKEKGLIENPIAITNNPQSEADFISYSDAVDRYNKGELEQLPQWSGAVEIKPEKILDINQKFYHPSQEYRYGAPKGKESDMIIPQEAAARIVLSQSGIGNSPYAEKYFLPKVKEQIAKIYDAGFPLTYKQDDAAKKELMDARMEDMRNRTNIAMMKALNAIADKVGDKETPLQFDAPKLDGVLAYKTSNGDVNYPTYIIPVKQGQGVKPIKIDTYSDEVIVTGQGGYKTTKVGGQNVTKYEQAKGKHIMGQSTPVSGTLLGFMGIDPNNGAKVDIITKTAFPQLGEKAPLSDYRPAAVIQSYENGARVLKVVPLDKMANEIDGISPEDISNQIQQAMNFNSPLYQQNQSQPNTQNGQININREFE